VSHFVPHLFHADDHTSPASRYQTSEEWLRAGVHIEVRERGEVIGDLVPRTPPKPPVELPDFEARLKEMWGDRVFPNAVLEEREQSRY
jgi:antitoxin (DNA-binding transcriptional repressor) of toxin-antitoxin stability system